MIWLLLLAVAANWQLVETWHHGELFARARAWFEARGGLSAELVGCPFCLSHWTAILVTAVVAGSELSNHGSVDWWLVPLFWLAVVRLSNLANDCTHAVCRTPRRYKELAQEMEQLNGVTAAGASSAATAAPTGESGPGGG